ncbi:MAG: glutamate synthase central domain-containing protein, partial [Gammaproteobacteria bacterium]
IPSPVLTNEELARIRDIHTAGHKAQTISILYPVAEGGTGMGQALIDICRQAEAAIEAGNTFIILSDRGLNHELAPLPALLATSAVHHHLIRKGGRTRVGLVIESGEPREVHHFATLIGYGAGAINPYLAFESIGSLIGEGYVPEMEYETAVKNFIKAVNKGINKTMSKMGISTVQSYRGAQIFEAIGLNKDFIDSYFSWTASRIGGIGLDVVAQEAALRHHKAFPPRQVGSPDLEWGGEYQWRRDGEYHLFNPHTVFKLQHATSSGQYKIFKEYTGLVDNQNEHRATLRGLFEFKLARKPVPIEEVEPIENIMKRFSTGAMSFGAISQEAHETLAIAMNRIGGKSNCGEGGEDSDRYTPDANGDLRRSAIKQVASGRFGVTSEYLVNADDIQIKMAQGAKPGEGGQLPGPKV